jgi:hypothetical protein
MAANYYIYDKKWRQWNTLLVRRLNSTYSRIAAKGLRDIYSNPIQGSKTLTMSKIILEFDGVEEYQEAKLAMDAMNWKLAVWDIDQKLRQTTKYGVSILHNDKVASDIEIEIAEKYREEIGQIIHKYSLNLDI